MMLGRVNMTRGCERPANCRGKPPTLCRRCRARGAVENAQTERPPKLGSVIRIEITAERRRHLTAMAKEVGKTVDELASGLLSDVIDDDAKAHGVRA